MLQVMNQAPRKFCSGQVVEYLGSPTHRFIARRGALAVVDTPAYETDEHGEIHLCVRWVRNGFDDGQMDGGYPEELFKVAWVQGGLISVEEEPEEPVWKPDPFDPRYWEV